MRPSLEEAMRQLINQYSGENGSNTPDYVLSRYLMQCLDAFDTAVKAREQHSKRDE